MLYPGPVLQPTRCWSPIVSKGDLDRMAYSALAKKWIPLDWSWISPNCRQLFQWHFLLSYQSYQAKVIFDILTSCRSDRTVNLLKQVWSQLTKEKNSNNLFSISDKCCRLTFCLRISNPNVVPFNPVLFSNTSHTLRKSMKREIEKQNLKADLSILFPCGRQRVSQTSKIWQRNLQLRI